MTNLRSWQLFAICVLTWSTTWHAITYQVHYTSPEYGVTLRFALAGISVLLLCMWRGTRWRMSLKDHGALAVQGCFMYGVSYLCTYHAEQHLPSGLVAVGFSASPLTSGFGALLLFGTLVSRRFLLGGLMAVLGVALIFLPEFSKASTSRNTLVGTLFTLGALLLSTIGSLIASRNRERGIPLWPSMGWGMLYGAAGSFVFVLAMGQPLALPSAPAWWLSLFYLAWAGSVMTFACYLTLLDRLGPGPAGTVGVMTPLLALVVSMVMEGYRADLFTGLGVALAVGGNALILARTAPSLEKN
jgi:drug/metabolite transporter (DMT)-like permease